MIGKKVVISFNTFNEFLTLKSALYRIKRTQEEQLTSLGAVLERAQIKFNKVSNLTYEISIQQLKPPYKYSIV